MKFMESSTANTLIFLSAIPISVLAFLITIHFIQKNRIKEREDRMMIYVFDIDGTLTIAGDRLNELKKDPPDWDRFYDRCDEDEPNQAIINLLRILDLDDHQTLLLTGRRESCRKKTITYFEDHGVPVRCMDLVMRPDGNHEKGAVLKPKLFNEWARNRGLHKIDKSRFLFFEDASSVTKIWRELGYTCCQVEEGDF